MLPMNRLGWGWADPDAPEESKGWSCKFTKEETRTMITLWCIFRAPLMIGTDLPQLDDFNLSLLTNEEIIAMNKCPNQARQLSPSLAGEKIVAWYNYIGPGEDGQNHAYYAFFNITDEDQTLTFNAKAEETADGSAPAKPLIRDLWEHKDLGDSVKLVLPPHSCKAFRV